MLKSFVGMEPRGWRLFRGSDTVYHMQLRGMAQRSAGLRHAQQFAGCLIARGGEAVFAGGDAPGRLTAANGRRAEWRRILPTTVR